MIDVRDGLKVCIERSGLKQTAIADRVSMSDQQICDIVNKRRRLDANELFAICKVIGATPNDVYAASATPDIYLNLETA